MRFGMDRLMHFRVEDDLGNAVSVPEVDENDPAMVPPSLNPAHQHDFRADIIFSQLTAVMGPAHTSKII
jgi:hypothetical protein